MKSPTSHLTVYHSPHRGHVRVRMVLEGDEFAGGTFMDLNPGDALAAATTLIGCASSVGKMRRTYQAVPEQEDLAPSAGEVADPGPRPGDPHRMALARIVSVLSEDHDGETAGCRDCGILAIAQGALRST